MQHTSKASSSTIREGFNLLKCFTQSTPLLGNKELSQLCELPPSTVARITHTFCELGLLVKVERYRKYRLGYGALTLAYPVLANMRERHLARQFMKDLTDQTGGQTSMAVLHQLDAVYVESFRPEEHWLSKPEIGTTRPALHTAIGHALLYSLDAKKFNYLMSLAKETLGRKFASARAQISDSFMQIDKKGFCSVRGTYRPELHAVAVPLTKKHSDNPIAFNLSLKAYDKAPPLHEFGIKLVELRDRTNEQLGEQP